MNSAHGRWTQWAAAQRHDPSGGLGSHSIGRCRKIYPAMHTLEQALVAVRWPHRPAGSSWSSGLFDCMDDMSVCAASALCPCLVSGWAACMLWAHVDNTNVHAHAEAGTPQVGQEAAPRKRKQSNARRCLRVISASCRCLLHTAAWPLTVGCLRAHARARLHIEATPGDSSCGTCDGLACLCCPLCSLMQVAREVRWRRHAQVAPTSAATAAIAMAADDSFPVRPSVRGDDAENRGHEEALSPGERPRPQVLER